MVAGVNENLLVVLMRSENMVEITVDEEKCNGCGECIDVCPSEVYELQGGKSKAINLDECIECCACVEVCEPQAIKHSSC